MKYYNKSRGPVNITGSGQSFIIAPKSWAEVPAGFGGSARVLQLLKQGVLIKENVIEDAPSLSVPVIAVHVDSAPEPEAEAQLASPAEVAQEAVLVEPELVVQEEDDLAKAKKRKR